MGVNPLVSVKFQRIKGKLTGISLEQIDPEEKTPERTFESGGKGGDVKNDFWETKNGYIARVGDKEFRTLTEPDEFYIKPVFLLYVADNPEFLEDAIEKDKKILDYLNKELERFGYYPVNNVTEFKALFTPDEIENLQKKVELIIEKDMIPFYGFPLTHDYAVSLIIRRLCELYGKKPKIRTLPLKKEEVQVDKELLTNFSLEDVRECLNFFKRRNIVACILEVLSRKPGGENLKEVLEKNKDIFQFPLAITEIFE
jgi:hypothetical protein